MSDHRERACTECGSLLHHEDDCPRGARAVCIHRIPVGMRCYDCAPEPLSEERESIARYLEWCARMDIGSVLSRGQREGVAYAAAWVRNRLDQRHAAIKGESGE